MVSDEEFVARLDAARCGDPYACLSLWDRYAGQIRAFLLTRGTPDADEVVNDVFLAAFTGVEGFVGGEPEFRAWLYRVARNKRVDAIRAHERRPTPTDAPSPLDHGAGLVIACAMPGPEPIDESCASEASLGLQMVQALTGTSVLEVFVHTNEAARSDGVIDEERLLHIATHRCQAHADNALRMLFDPDEMIERAGSGRRQGADDEGTLATASGAR